MKKITKILSFIFLITLLASCSEKGCIAPEEFDEETVIVEANPTADGITGSYNSTNGGQRANWHDTGLKTNGTPLLIKISGNWGPWGGDLTKLQRCDFCAKKDSAVNPSNIDNCICYDNNGFDPVSKRETPMPEIGINGDTLDVNCNTQSNQNDPKQCSCTTLNGKATDYGVYHIPLNFEEKDEVVLVPDKQSICKYDRGMGLYLGLFGSSGVAQPSRLYHLFSEEELCDIGRNDDGKCIDKNGNNALQYVFRSANYDLSDAIVKNDNHNNDGSYTVAAPGDPAVSYHQPNEAIKVMIYDNYYSDNTGSYTLTFLGGVSNGSADDGLIEYLVKIVEDNVLGTLDSNNVRQGGLIEFFFKSITQDTYFIAILQFSLSLYIMFFGVGVLIGVVEIDRKELTSRIMKIALVLFFTTPAGWYFYNELVVKFFKDGMDSVISMFMSMSDRSLGQETSMQIKIAQMGRDGSYGNSLRFSYADLIIKKLIAGGTTKKVWGLAFGSVFGFIYIILFYCLVAGFIGVMLYAATIYLLAMLKLALVLAMGPIFICFTLFAHTNDMFKKWLAFLGARSLEIVFLFLILYSFLYIIDRNFTSLLFLKACYTPLFSTNIGFNENASPWQMIVLKTDSAGRTFVQWMIAIINIGGLIFILKVIIDQMPKVSQSLIDIGGGGSGTSGNGASFEDQVAKGGGIGSSTALAGELMGNLFSAAKKAAAKGVPALLATAAKAGDTAARVTGVSNMAAKISNKIPISGPRAMARNLINNKAYANAVKSANERGLTGANRERAIRAATLQAIQTDNSKAGALAGISTESALKMLDKKLVANPLRAKIKEFAKQLKQGDPDNIPLGQNMTDQIKDLANQWADANLSGGRAAIKDHLKDLSGFMAKEGELTTSQAAKKFANNRALQNKYLQHLKNHELDQAKKQAANEYKPFAANTDDLADGKGDWTAERQIAHPLAVVENKMIKLINPIGKFIKKSSNALGSGIDAIKDDVISNPKSAARSFIRKSQYADQRKSDVLTKLGIDSTKGLNPFRSTTYTGRINNIDKDSAYFRNKDFEQEAKKAAKIQALSYALAGGYEQERAESQARIKNRYDQEIQDAPNDFAKKRLEAKKAQKLDELDEELLAKKDSYYQPLKQEIEGKISAETKRQIAEAKPYLKSAAQKQEEAGKTADKIKTAIRNPQDGDEKQNREREKLEKDAKKIKNDIIKSARSEYAMSTFKARKSGKKGDMLEALENKAKLEHLKTELTANDSLATKTPPIKPPHDTESKDKTPKTPALETPELKTQDPKTPKPKTPEPITPPFTGEQRATPTNLGLGELSAKASESRTPGSETLELTTPELPKTPLIAEEQPITPTNKLLETIPTQTFDVSEPKSLDTLNAISQQLGQFNTSLDQLEVKINSELGKLNEKLEANNITIEKYSEELQKLTIDNQVLVATELKVEFGASISDMLLKEMNIGLKQSNVLLGVPDNINSQATAVAKAAFDAQESQCKCKLKMTIIDKKIKEMEKYNLEEAYRKESNKDKKAAIKAMLDEVASSLKAIETEEVAINNQIKEIEKYI